MSAKSSERYMNDAANWLQSHTRTRTHTTLLALVSPFICIWIGRLIGSKYIYKKKQRRESESLTWEYGDWVSAFLDARYRRKCVHALRQRYNYSSENKIPRNQRFSRHDYPFIIWFCLCAFDCKSLRQSNSATTTCTQSRCLMSPLESSMQLSNQTTTMRKNFFRATRVNIDSFTQRHLYKFQLTKTQRHSQHEAHWNINIISQRIHSRLFLFISL